MAERALLFEIQRKRRKRPDPADPAAELGDLGADRGVGQHAQAEREGCRGDIKTLFNRQAKGDGIHVGRLVLAVRGRGGPAPGGATAGVGEQAQGFAVAEHPGGDA